MPPVPLVFLSLTHKLTHTHTTILFAETQIQSMGGRLSVPQAPGLTESNKALPRKRYPINARVR